MYYLEYLPLAMQDMVEIVKYIAQTLSSPLAAKKLADGMINAAEDLRMFPHSKPVHITKKPLKHEYRRLAVNKYIMLYWINEAEKKIVISRVIYAHRDFDKLDLFGN